MPLPRRSSKTAIRIARKATPAGRATRDLARSMLAERYRHQLYAASRSPGMFASGYALVAVPDELTPPDAAPFVCAGAGQRLSRLADHTQDARRA